MSEDSVLDWPVLRKTYACARKTYACARKEPQGGGETCIVEPGTQCHDLNQGQGQDQGHGHVRARRAANAFTNAIVDANAAATTDLQKELHELKATLTTATQKSQLLNDALTHLSMAFDALEGRVEGLEREIRGRAT
jgi:hypothetical protein